MSQAETRPRPACEDCRSPAGPVCSLCLHARNMALLAEQRRVRFGEGLPAKARPIPTLRRVVGL